MVAVLHAAPQATAPHAIAAWVQSLVATYGAQSAASVEGAIAYVRERAGEDMPDGEPILDRGLGAASILAAIRLDVDALVAAVLLGLPVSGTFDPAARR